MFYDCGARNDCVCSCWRLTCNTYLAIAEMDGEDWALRQFVNEMMVRGNTWRGRLGSWAGVDCVLW